MKQPITGDRVHYKAGTDDEWSADTKIYIGEGSGSNAGYFMILIGSDEYSFTNRSGSFRVEYVDEVSLPAESEYAPYTKEYLDGLDILPRITDGYDTNTILAYDSHFMSVIAGTDKELHHHGYNAILREWKTLDGNPAGILKAGI